MFAGAGVGQAQPGDEDTVTAPGDDGSFPLSWPALGLTDNVVLDPYISLGDYTPQTYSVPVPAGMSATRLQGIIRRATNTAPGYLSINDSTGRLLAAVELPPPGAATAVAPFDVDISTAQVRAGVMDLSFTVQPTEPIDRVCGPLQLITLSDLSTVYTGIEAPVTTIAEFFPQVLDRVSVYAPFDADAAEQQSVLTLVSTLARLYQAQALPITVVNQPRGAAPPPVGQRSRAIVVESGDAGLELENPGTPGTYLRVSGSGEELTTQVSLLVNELQSMAQAPFVRVDQAGAPATPAGDTVTFDQMGISGQLDVLRTNRLSVAAPVSALGSGRVDSVEVHLLADYTPVADGDAATVVIRSNGAVVYRSLLDDSGRLDATFTVDRQELGQWMALEFVLTYTPRQICGPLIAPLTFQLDPRSTMTVHQGGPPRGGFAAFPSEFSPTYMVALDGSSPNQLGYAAAVVASVAEQTTTQLTPQVVDLESAAESTSGALIVARSEAIQQTALTPPVSGDDTVVDFRLPTELRANIQDGIGSIQAFADQARNRSVVLVTTTGAWTLVDPLFGYLEQADGGWAQLFGDVLAAGVAGTPTNVEIRAGADTAEASDAGEGAQSPSQLPNPWILGGVAVAVIAVIGTVAAALWARRRRAARPAGPDDEPSSTPGHRA